MQRSPVSCDPWPRAAPRRRAPEVLLEHRGVEAPADVWSVGALALHALTGRPPWHGLTHAQVLQQVRALPHAQCSRMSRSVLNSEP